MTNISEISRLLYLCPSQSVSRCYMKCSCFYTFKSWVFDRCAGADPCACTKRTPNTPTGHLYFLMTFFFFNACLNSSRKAFNFPQGKFHVANLFSAVCLTNTKTHFMLLFGKVHDIYVNTVFVTKA